VTGAFPETFPGAWQNIPLEVRRYLAQRLLDKSLAIHDGPAGLIKFLYAGTHIQGMSVAETYRITGESYWPFVVRDTEAWLAQRAAK